MKKLFFLLTLLLATSVLSADYADSFSEYRIQVKNALGVEITNSTWVSDTTMNDMIRQAVIAVGPIVRPKKEQFSFITTYMSGTYDLDSTVLGISDIYWRKNDSLKTFTYMPKQSWYQSEVRVLTGKTGFEMQPTYYDFEDDKLFLFPIPINNGDTIVYDAFTKVIDVSASTDLSTIPQQYRTAILDYVCYRVAVLKQHPLTDIYYRNYQESISIINATLNRRGVPVETSTP